MGNEDQSCKCSTETCDIFDFMANTVGLTVLHPGGFKATRELAALCGIDASTHVLDNACGKGTTSLFLHSNYGCRVAGVDFDPNLLAQARRLAQKKKAGDRVEF